MGRHWDAATSSPWYAYEDGGQAHVAWYDDETSLGAKYEMANGHGLGGVGIWNLDWGSGAAAMWTALEKAFAENVA